MVSTIAMVRLGKVYGNKMVDVSVSNNKLLDRGLRILNELANVNRKDGIELLTTTNGSVKLALIMRLTGLDLQRSQELLNNNEQHLRKSINNIRNTE